MWYNAPKDNKGYMMTMTVGMRELARNSNILDGYDYVEVEDKKTHEYKGLFKEIQAKWDRVQKYIGKGKVDERFNNLTSSQLREKVALEKYANVNKFYDCGIEIMNCDKFLENLNVEW